MLRRVKRGAWRSDVSRTGKGEVLVMGRREKGEEEEEGGKTRTDVDIDLFKLLLEPSEVDQHALNLLLVDWRFFSRHSSVGFCKGERARGGGE